MANLLGEVFGSASAVLKGMGVTMKEMMSPTVTENYPDEPPKLAGALSRRSRAAAG